MIGLVGVAFGTRKIILFSILMVSIFTVSTFFSQANAIGPIPPPPGLLDWWPGDGNAIDITGGQNGVLQGTTTFAPGEVGPAFSFLVPTDYVKIPNSNNWHFGSSDFTIDLWFNLNTIPSVPTPVPGTPFTSFIANDNGPGNISKWIFGIGGVPGSSQITFLFTDTLGNPIFVNTTPLNILPHQWYHIAVTRTGTLFTFYLNGNPVYTKTVTNVLSTPTSALDIGWAEAIVTAPNGLVDEVQIYGRALSASEVQAIFNAGSAGMIKVPLVPCAPGTFSASGDEPCTPAPVGTFVPTAGATSATPCPPGTYSDVTGSIACIPAPAGSFATGPGATSATQCPVGTFTNAAGQTACTPAPPGSYVGTTGATSSTQCAAGTFQPNAGQTSCILASPGFFVSTSGATQQTQCPSGTTSDVSGSTSCHPASTPGKVTGEGKIGKDQNFEFEVRSSDGKTFKGHLEFHDKTAHIEIESHTMTQLFVDSFMTHAIFAGQATTDSDHHDDDKNSAPALAFSVTVTDPDKTGDHDTFSITITDSAGNIIYQNSGTIHGHIEIHPTNHGDDDHDDKDNNDKN